jgi:hypothetical protein
MPRFMPKAPLPQESNTTFCKTPFRTIDQAIEFKKAPLLILARRTRSKTN